MQQVVCKRPCNGALMAAGRQPAPRRISSIVRAGDDKSRVVREYREDSDKVVVPGGEQKEKALYVDQLPPAMKQKDNLSKEMKQRLRQEYYGLGGAENQAMNSNYFLWIILIISALAVLSKLTGAI